MKVTAAPCSSDPALEHFPGLVLKLTSFIPVFFGALALGLWSFPTSRPFISNWMKANSATGFILMGSSLWLSREESRRTGMRRAMATLLALAAGCIGILTLLEYANGKSLFIDELLFHDVPRGPGEIPGRLAPNTAFCLVLLSASLTGLALLKTWKKWVSAFAMLTGAIALLALVGYLNSVKSMYQVGVHLRMSPVSAFMLSFLSVGVLFGNGNHWPISEFTSRSPGGYMARRFLIPSFAIPIFWSWILLNGEKLGWYRTDVGASIGAVLLVFSFLYFIWRNARQLNESDMHRLQYEKRLAQSAELERFLGQATSALVEKRDLRTALREIARLGEPVVADAIQFELIDIEGKREQLGISPSNVEECKVVSLPMKARERVFGYMTLYYRGKNEFNRTTSIYAETIASRTAGAVENQRLAQDRARLEEILEATSDFVGVTNETQKSIYLNAAGRKMMGYTLDQDLSAIPIASYHPAWVNEMLQKEVFPLVCREGYWSGESALLTPEGKEIPASQVIIAHRLPNGDISYLSTIARDISVAKATELELSRSNEDLARFAYVVSHDLQEPLRSVTTFMMHLSQRYREKLDKDAHDYIAFAVDGAKRMKRLIDDLLHYSRVGNSSKEFRAVSCEDVLRNVLKNLKATLEETGAKVTWDSLPTVRADPTQLGQVFQNLIGNAIKYCDLTPEIHFSSVEFDGELACLHVRDNGIGIDMKFADRIFEIFQRLHGRDEYSGTGIGLAVCKKIIERHGGKVWLESQVGKGSSFYLTLPRFVAVEASESRTHAFMS